MQTPTNRKLPAVGTLVITSVAKITKFGAYCRLPEYEDLEVFLPIREISSGWIKNIREHIHEGQKVVCVVSFYDREKGTIDVSLKKVTPSKSKEKIRSYNLEKRLAALFAQAVKVSKEEDKDAPIAAAVSEFGTYTNLVQNATGNTEKFAQSGIPKRVKEALLKVLEASRKHKTYKVSYIATVETQNYAGGAAELRDIFSRIKEKVGLSVKYIGAPKYRIVADGKDYADAESKAKRAGDIIRQGLQKGRFEMEKERLRKEKEDIMEGI